MPLRTASDAASTCGNVIDLIYCASGNRRFADTAVAAGFRLGARLPGTVYTDVAPLHFADQDWKDPDRRRYFNAAAALRPRLMTVLDLERLDQLDTVLSWAEEAARIAETVIVIPKVCGATAQLPRSIGGKEMRLGFSVPTGYGKTDVPVEEFAGWPVHLLGGAPQAQMRYALDMDVQSADGNYAMKMAMTGNVWVAGTFAGSATRNRWWPYLRELGCHADDDVPYEAFRRSCTNIAAAWRGFHDNPTYWKSLLERRKPGPKPGWRRLHAAHVA